MKKLFLLGSVIVFSSMIFITSCKKDKDTNPGSEPTGYVSGKVVSPNGTALPQCKVFVDAGCEIYLTVTDKDGKFNLEAPSGKHMMYIESGNGTTYRTVMEIEIPEDGTVTLPNGQVTLTQVAQLAYIAGAYDQIEALITNLGYTATEIQLTDLDNLSTLQNYATIFLNCGKSGVLDSLKYANLAQYVSQGGNLYASDWAVEYLTGDGYYNMKYNKPFILKKRVQEVLKMTCMGDIGGFIDDATLCTEKIGPVQWVYGAQVVAPDLQSYLGTNTIDIEYDLGGWEQVMTLTEPWEVLVSDNTFGPLAIRTTYSNNGGNKIQQMMDQGWVTICHIPPGNPSNAHTITISVNALPAHLAHGDNIGACSGDGGKIYYTTFHNHASGMINPQVQKILEYFIVSL